MSRHRLAVDPATPVVPHATLEIIGDEAHHAVRVKRLVVGDAVELINGQGVIAAATIADTGKRRGEWVVRIDVHSVTIAPPPTPRIHVASAVPKGPRLADMIDQLSQVGATGWSPLITDHSHTDATELRHDRLQRVALEASKQSGRPWLMQIDPELRLAHALAPHRAAASGLSTAEAPDRPTLILADATGDALKSLPTQHARVLIGPEGGWTTGELEAARGAGATIARFGPHTMRIETAAVAACAILMSL
jgi:16S rRNA (uracil1498-N3)-methyltransferase